MGFDRDVLLRAGIEEAGVRGAPMVALFANLRDGLSTQYIEDRSSTTTATSMPTVSPTVVRPLHG